VRQPDHEAERTRDHDAPTGPLQSRAFNGARAATAMDVADDREQSEHTDLTGNQCGRRRFAGRADGDDGHGEDDTDNQHNPSEAGDKRARRQREGEAEADERHDPEEPVRGERGGTDKRADAGPQPQHFL
jgi:hypothetical protein